MIQGSQEWFKARLAKITGSEMSRVMGGPRAWASYARQLREEMAILERLEAGEEIELGSDFDTAATAWGRKWEPTALAEYSFHKDADVNVAGFAIHPDFSFIGCSVDAKVYVDDDIINGIVEIKCPFSESVHLHTLSCGVVPGQHVQQIQTGIWVHDVNWGDFVSYDRRRDLTRQLFIKRLNRDDIYISLMEARCLEFWNFVNSGRDDPGKIKSGQIGSNTIPQLF